MGNFCPFVALVLYVFDIRVQYADIRELVLDNNAYCMHLLNVHGFVWVCLFVALRHTLQYLSHICESTKMCSATLMRKQEYPLSPRRGDPS